MQPSTLQNFSTAKDFHEEEERMKLRILQADAGLIGNKDLMVTAERMDWMYHNPVQSKQAQEDYLLGKPIQPVDEKQEMRKRLGAGAAASSSLFLNTVTANNEDTMRRLREDPLFLIQQAKYRQTRLECARENILTTIQKPYGDKNETKLYYAHDLVFHSSRSGKQKVVTATEGNPCLSANSHEKISRLNKISSCLSDSRDPGRIKKKNSIPYYSHTSSSRHKTHYDPLLTVDKKTLPFKHSKNSSIDVLTKSADFSPAHGFSSSSSSTNKYKNCSQSFLNERISSKLCRDKSYSYEIKKYRSCHKKGSISPSFNPKQTSHKHRHQSRSASCTKRSHSRYSKRNEVLDSCKRIGNQTCSSVPNDNQRIPRFQRNHSSPTSHGYSRPLNKFSVSPGCRRFSRYRKSDELMQYKKNSRSNSVTGMRNSNHELHKIKKLKGHKSTLEEFRFQQQSSSRFSSKKHYKNRRSVSRSNNYSRHSNNFSRECLKGLREKDFRFSPNKINGSSLESDSQQRFRSRNFHSRSNKGRRHIQGNLNYVKNPNTSHKEFLHDEETQGTDFLTERQHHSSRSRGRKDPFLDDAVPLNTDNLSKHISTSPSSPRKNKQHICSHTSQDSVKSIPNFSRKITKSVSSTSVQCLKSLKKRSSSRSIDYRSRTQYSTDNSNKNHRYEKYPDRTESSGNGIPVKRKELTSYSDLNKSSERIQDGNVEKTDSNSHFDCKKIVHGPVCPSEWKGRLDAYSIDNKQTIEDSVKDSDHDESLNSFSDSNSDLGPPQSFIETITSLRTKKSTVPHLVSRRLKQYNNMNTESLFSEKEKKPMFEQNISQKNVTGNSELELKQMMDDGLKHEKDKEEKLKVIDCIDSIRDTFVAKERERIWISDMVPIFEKKLLVESTENESKTLNDRLKRYVARRQRTLLDCSELEDEQK